MLEETPIINYVPLHTRVRRVNMYTLTPIMTKMSGFCIFSVVFVFFLLGNVEFDRDISNTRTRVRKILIQRVPVTCLHPINACQGECVFFDTRPRRTARIFVVLWPLTKHLRACKLLLNRRAQNRPRANI